MQKSELKTHPLKNSLNQGDYNKSAETLIPNEKNKKCVILCTFVYSKSPKPHHQKHYSDHTFYTDKCVKMYTFSKKCNLKQVKMSIQSALQPSKLCILQPKAKQEGYYSSAKTSNFIKKCYTFSQLSTKIS